MVVAFWGLATARILSALCRWMRWQMPKFAAPARAPYVLVGALAYLGCLLAGTSNTVALTLEEALQTLLEQHPQIQAAKKSVEAAEHAIDVAHSRFLPTVS